MNVIMVVRDEPFPVGMACTNRILSLAKGLVENRIPVKIVCLKPTERSAEHAVNTDPRGVFNGIEYEYSCGTTVRGRTFVGRQWLKIKGIVRCLIIVMRSRKAGGRGVLMAWVRQPLYVVLFFIIARIFGSVYVRDITEYPFIFFDRSLRDRWRDFFYRRYFAKFHDAIFVMTKPLLAYYSSRLGGRTSMLQVPMTVESSRFIGVEAPAPVGRRYIAYCGYLGGNKDGVPNLLRAFAMLPAALNDVMLYVIGDAPDTNDLEELKLLARDLGISKRVVFTGRVPRNEIPRYLCHAAILALARPGSLQAEGGFPSKVGEYLSTGKPVVLTRVGDIPEYLEDGRTAFIVEPDDNRAFAQKMEFALNHPDIAAQVGLNGRQVALHEFDYRIQARKIIQFLSGLTGEEAPAVQVMPESVGCSP